VTQRYIDVNQDKLRTAVEMLWCTVSKNLFRNAHKKHKFSMCIRA
jgi:hypothetical protein